MVVEMEKDTFVPRQLPQLIASLSCSFGGFVLGQTVGWSAPSLPQIVGEKEFGELNIDQTSWVASLPLLGGMFVGPFAGLAMGAFGRRGTLIGLSVPTIIGWMFCAFATSLCALYLGRFILGCCVGCYVIIVNVYIAEISQEQLRGALGFLFPISVSAGVLYTYVLGALVSWKTLTIVNMAVAVILLVSMCYVPESTIHLLSKGKKKDAGKALKWLRGAGTFDQIENELNQMQHFVEESVV